MIDVRGDDVNAEKYLAKTSFHSNKLFHQTKEVLECFHLEDIIDESLSLFNEMNGNKLVCRIHPERSLINSDKQKFISIVHNLLDNANKNTSRGNIHAYIKLVGNCLYIRVTDTGCNFNISKLHLLFKPLTKVSKLKPDKVLVLPL